MAIKKPTTKVRFVSFPRTTAPPEFVYEIVSVFSRHENQISTEALEKGLVSDAVLKILAKDLTALGFEVEGGKKKNQKIERPVFFGENGQPSVRYEIDGYHSKWKCGLEIEAGRAIMGNAIFRDLFQAMVMSEVNHLCLAVSNAYRYQSSGKTAISKDYDKTSAVAEALYAHGRTAMPYGLSVIGY